MTGKKLTIRDIAKVAGVSYASVSRSLSGSPGISQNTRTHILEVCKTLGYTMNYAARTLAIQKSQLIGFIVGSVDNPYMGQLACQVELYARQKGYTVILGNSLNKEELEAELFPMLMGRQVDGIIIIPANLRSFDVLETYFEQIPTVFIGDNLKDDRKSYVTVDNYRGAFLGTEYLVSLGHRSIVYIGHRQGSTTHRIRLDGYIDACKAYRIESAIIDNRGPASSIEQGYSLGKQLFSGSFPYTAVFAATDTTALGVMQAADEAGIAIPGDISLMGFDNISYSRLPRINLTTIEQPFNAMASSAVDMLINNIEHPGAGYSHTVLAPSLVKRGTCGMINVNIRSTI
jgi:LacI family transcriptional regulator